MDEVVGSKPSFGSVKISIHVLSSIGRVLVSKTKG